MCSCGGNETVIKIGQKAISKKDFEITYKNYGLNEKNDSLVKASLVSQIIETEILMKEAEKAGIKVSDKTVKDFMAENNIKEEKRQIAVTYVLRNLMIEKLSENQKKDYVFEDADKGKFSERTPDKIIFYQILVNTLDEAKKVISEINSGVDFESLAKKYSVSPEGKKGGLIDYLNEDELPKEIKTALSSTKIGKITAPIKTSYGYHILMPKEFLKSRQLTKGEIESLIAKESHKRSASLNYANWLAQKRKEYEVSVKWADIEKINLQ